MTYAEKLTGNELSLMAWNCRRKFTKKERKIDQISTVRKFRTSDPIGAESEKAAMREAESLWLEGCVKQVRLSQE